MGAANLTQSERMEFLQWLVRRKEQEGVTAGAKVKEAKATRLKEIKECFSWLKARVTEAELSDSDRKEFDLWMAKRARESDLLDD